MASVEKIGFAPVSFRGNDNKTQDVKTTDLKKYVTPTNVALSSLAALGVLGMADILICKGKHINKLTGKGKELEEALERATSAEARATGLETEFNKLQEQYDKITEFVDTMKELSGKERLSEIVSGGLIHVPLYNTGAGKTLLRDLKLLYEVFLEDESISVKEREFLTKWVKNKFEKNGCELVEKFAPEMSADFEVSCTGSGDVPVATVPILKVIGSDKVLYPGHVVFPRLS